MNTEFAGVIESTADFGGGFIEGVTTLTSTLTPHGPGADVWEGATNAELFPQKADGMLFVVETNLQLPLTAQAAQAVGYTDDETLSGRNTAPRNFSI